MRRMRVWIILGSLMGLILMAFPVNSQISGLPVEWNSVYSGVPVGTIVQYAGQAVPDGWLLCDGSAVSRTDFPDLYAVFSTVYGTGDGVTTFNLPNCSGRTLVSTGTSDQMIVRGIGQTYGENFHKLTTAEMPLHQHGLNNYQLLRRTPNTGGVDAPSNSANGSTWWTGSTAFAGGDQPFPVSQPSLVTYFIIWSGVGSAAMGEGGGGVQPTPAPEVIVYSTVANGEVTQAVGFAYTIDAGQIGIMVLLFAIFVVLMLRAVTDLIGWRRGN